MPRHTFERPVSTQLRFKHLLLRHLGGVIVHKFAALRSDNGAWKQRFVNDLAALSWA